MHVDYTKTALRQLEDVPIAVRKAFYKQAELLRRNLNHPSLHAKKYDETHDVWQARVNRSWRFYFAIQNDIYLILSVTRHPK
jgi:mRNA interferase RelE/StbE